MHSDSSQPGSRQFGPDISVVMSVRNGEAFIRGALDSLVSQTFRNFEIIVVDNGSSDLTPKILEKYEAREPRLRRFFLKQPGVARSLNYGAERALAPILARLDADDWARPDRLTKQFARMQEQPHLGLLGSFVQLIDSRGRKLAVRRLPVTDPELRKVLQLGQFPFIHSGLMMRRDVFERAGRYREELSSLEDFDLCYRIAALTEMANVELPLVHYRIHSSSQTFRNPVRTVITLTSLQAALRKSEAGPIPCLRVALPALGMTRKGLVRKVLLYKIEHRARLILTSCPYFFRRLYYGLGVRRFFARSTAIHWEKPRFDAAAGRRG